MTYDVLAIHYDSERCLIGVETRAVCYKLRDAIRHLGQTVDDFLDDNPDYTLTTQSSNMASCKNKITGKTIDFVVN